MFTEQLYFTMILYHIINIKVAAFNINLRESNIIATSVTQNALKTKKQVHKSISVIHTCDPDGVPWMPDLKRNMKLSDQEKSFILRYSKYSLDY